MTSTKILREPAVRLLTGLSRTTRWRLVRSGDFPAPVRLTTHTIGWIADDIEAWIRSRKGDLQPWAPSLAHTAKDI